MEIIIAFVVFLLFFIAMALGVLLQGKPLKGSCGGMATLMGNKECQICGGDPLKCEEEQKPDSNPVADSKDLAYDAAKKD